LPPASRVEFLLHGPAATVKTAHLMTTAINTGANGDCDPWRPLFLIQQVAANDPTLPAPDAFVPGYSRANTTPPRFAGILTAPIAAQRLVYFDENSTQSEFYMAVAGQPLTTFNPNAPPAIVATQGTVEEWTVENHAQENHEFHFHQLHFMLESQLNFGINGQPQAPAIDGQFLDMVEVPGWDGNPAHPYPSVKLLIDFRGPDIGTFVFHCHILGHEDLGMMNIIQVVAPGTIVGAAAKPAVGAGQATPVAAKVADKASVPSKAVPAAGMSGMSGMSMDLHR